MHRMNFLKAAAGLVALGGFVTQAGAVDSTTNFQVLLNVTATCNAGAAAATNVNFGTVASTATNVTATGQLQVLCTSGTSYNISLDAGSYVQGGSRRMFQGGTNYLPYGLYRSVGTTQPWTDQIGERYSGTGSGVIQQINVYGVLPSANGPAGSYQDTVTATLTY